MTTIRSRRARSRCGARFADARAKSRSGGGEAPHGAILAGVGGGLWPSVDAACVSVVRVAARVRPNETGAAAMTAGYAAYRRVYPAIKSIFRT
jgi:xylulokinase